MADRSPADAKAPWTKPHIRGAVNRAIDAIGGPKAFAVQGRVFQEAIIDQCVFGMFLTATYIGKTSASYADMVATRQVAMQVAGIDND